MPASTRSPKPPPRGELIADTALALLSERGTRGLTHRAVDEAAGLPQGSTSNYARTRLALLEAAVRRLAEREAAVLTPPALRDAFARVAPDCRDPLIAALARTLHGYLTGEHRYLLISRYELALEAARRPDLRAYYDAAGARFREPMVTLMRTMGSPAPERHGLSLVAWCEGLLFACGTGSYGTAPPTEEDLRSGFRELLRGMLG